MTRLTRLPLLLLSLFALASCEEDQPSVVSGQDAADTDAEDTSVADTTDTTDTTDTLADAVAADTGPDTSDAVAADTGTQPETAAVVSAAWLMANIDSVQIVDVRGAAAFDAGHVRGAVLVDPASVRGRRDGIESQVLPAADVEMTLTNAGVSSDVPVVVVGDQVDTTSSRVAWVFANQGHDGAHLLDGGIGAWLAAGGETTTDTVPIASVNYVSGDGLDDYRVTADWVRDHLDDPGVSLVDVRTPGEYADGFIPGAININWTTNVAGGAFISEAALAELFLPLGEPGDTVVVYCRSGSRASVTWVALHWLGYDAVLYDGSWNDWGSLDEAEYPRATP